VHLPHIPESGFLSWDVSVTGNDDLCDTVVFTADLLISKAQGLLNTATSIIIRSNRAQLVHCMFQNKDNRKGFE
jgi:hypothetical protein